MVVYLLKRLGRGVVVCLLVTFLTAMGLNLIPGDPAIEMAGEGASPDVIHALREQYHFDQSALPRYGHWLSDAVVHGDLGSSHTTDQPVKEAILQRLPVTGQLTAMALFFAVILATALAAFTAYRPGSVVDRTVEAGSSVMLSVPQFVLALLLSYVIALQLKLVPVSGWVRLTENPWENFRSSIVPAMTLAVAQVVSLQRILRADLIKTLNEDFIVAARAKGVPEWKVFFRHVLRPSLFSMITVLGLSVGLLIGGAVLVENVFSLPGLGGLILNATNTKDFAVVQGAVAFIAVAYVLINTAVDSLYGVLDPRVRVRT